MMRLLMILLIGCFAMPILAAGSVSATIPFGQGENQVGRLKSEYDAWEPLFFAVSPDKLIHIPDFYQNRIAVFDLAGKFRYAVPCTGGLSPGMNWFALALDGSYLTYDNFTVWCIEPTGKIRWKMPLFLGAFPYGFNVSDTRLLAVFAPSELVDQKSESLLEIQLKPPYANRLIIPKSKATTIVPKGQESDAAADWYFSFVVEALRSGWRVLRLYADGSIASAKKNSNSISVNINDRKMEFPTNFSSPNDAFCLQLVEKPNGAKVLYYNVFTENSIEIRWFDL